MGLLLVAVASQLLASPVTASQAEQVARAFMARSHKTTGAVRMHRLAPVAADGPAAADQQPYYVFNADNEGGFVIVSGDDRFANVIGYADHGHFALDQAPSSLRAWMALYAQYVRAYWQTDSLAQGQPALAGATVVVKPLLGDIAWGQDAPFNDQCPTYTDGGTTTHYYTGCVAAAATQIMRYHRYPTQGTGQKSCVIKGLTLKADFGATTYDWANMLPYYERGGQFTQAQRDAVSTLAAQFGVAVEMEYEKAGSGASPMMVPGALRRYFGYDRGVTLRKRAYYATGEWMRILKAELDAGRPVYYGGASDTGSGGHAFVADGYDSNDYIHINWGWYGTSNGYFLVNRLNPGDLGEGGGTGGYNRDQEMVTGIQPPTGDSSSDVCLPVYGAARLGYTDYGSNRFSLMTILENLDTEAFSGLLGAVVTQNGQVLKVLKSEALTIAAYANGKSGVAYPTMRDIQATADGLADGDYAICLAYKADGAHSWQLVRHAMGLPRQVDMTVAGGRVTVRGAHAIRPRVELLEPITADNDIHAGGSALFRLHLRNNSTDVDLKEITVCLTSTADPTVSLTSSAKVDVYNESEKTVTVLADIPESVATGTYEVTAYEKGYADALFDDSQVGRTRVEVLPVTTLPVLSLTQPVEWSGSGGATTIKQADMLMLGMAVRNYGAAGKVGIVTHLQDVSDASRNYVFRQVDATFAKGQAQNLTTGRYLNVDPGTYQITVSAIAADGTEMAVRQPSAPVTVTVEPNADLAITVESLTLPTVLTPGKRVSGQLVVHLNTAYSGYVYLRLRAFTNTGGELVLMKRVSGAQAGDDVTLDFTYNPSLALGTYIPQVEFKNDAGSYVGANGLANYYRVFSVVDATGIDTEVAQRDVTIAADLSGSAVTIAARPGVVISRVAMTAASGAVVWAGQPADGRVDMTALPAGVYVVSVYTNHGVTTRKVLRR